MKKVFGYILIGVGILALLVLFPPLWIGVILYAGYLLLEKGEEK